MMLKRNCVCTCVAEGYRDKSLLHDDLRVFFKNKTFVISYEAF